MLPRTVTIALIATLAAITASCEQQVPNAPDQSLWTSDYAAGAKRAKAEGKLLLLDFTGSDWCQFCIRLKDDVLSTPQFRKFAERKFVLIEVDFPEQKAQPADLKAQNANLQEKYKITGFPTIVILDADGKELTRVVGYDGSTPDDWINALDKKIASARQ